MMDKRAVGDRVIKRQSGFQMRLGCGEAAGEQQGSARREVTQKEPSRIVALTAEKQQISVQALRQIQFAVDDVMERLRKRNLQEQ